jgi:hypothetical protein
MTRVGAKLWTGGAIIALAAAVLTPALAASGGKDRLNPRLSGRMGSFTPAVADPRLAAALARRGYQSGSFRFTPAAAEPNKDKAVRVAVRARPNTAVPAITNAAPGTSPAFPGITPSNYNLGANLSWKRFSVSGGIERLGNDRVPGERETAQLGVGYSGRKLGGSVKIAAERAEGTERIVGVDSSYSLDVGASYSIARNLNVTGGVRYKIQNDRLQALSEERRDSQAVYLGTSFRF